ncbi:uncharacterized protein CBL_09061 [Carabus blaptoides fortunei]
MKTCTLVSQEDCQKIVHKYDAGNFELVTFEVKPLGDEPMGFLGEHWRLNIAIRTANSKSVTLQFFMKSVPDGVAAHTRYIVNIGVFQKEALLYKQLFSKFQANATAQIVPKCYLVNARSHIVLEDLSLRNFAVVKDKAQTLDYAHCECLAETLGRFHAASIIFEEANSTSTEQYRIDDHFSDILYETTFSFEPGHPRNDWLITTTDTLICLCKKIDSYGDKDVERAIRLLIERMQEYIRPSKIFRNVINHGDLWSNNVMFKYTEDSVPEQCILVDYQMARYVPPGFDFLTFLYLTTSEQFHKTHFTALVDVYYSAFVQELSRQHIDAETIMSKNRFVECCEYYKPAALLESAMFATIVYLNDDFSKDMLSDAAKFDEFMLTNRSKLVCREFEEDPVFKSRVESVLVQLLECIL